MSRAALVGQRKTVKSPLKVSFATNFLQTPKGQI